MNEGTSRLSVSLLILPAPHYIDAQPLRREEEEKSLIGPENGRGGTMCDTADDGVGISNSVPEQERLKRVGAALG